MFYVLDNHLITICQRLVWHIELFTPLGRKEVAKLTIHIHWFFMAIFALLSLTTLLAEFSLDSLFATWVLVSFCAIHFIGQKTIHTESQFEKTSTWSLPRVIKMRYVNRAILLVSILIVTYVVLMSVSEYKQEIDGVVYFLAMLFPTSISYVVFCEYFLCTTSLPPGEKKRFKEKQEAEKMKISVSSLSG